ncbi:MAG: PIN domain-containing protein [Deltaproteobacteria bacterium]|nr:PIN domain-containing protein [Deltaproteobacteria bacterium]
MKKDDVFVDTNLWIYLYSDKEKGQKIRHLIDESYENIIISTQVLGEFFYAITKKGFKNRKEAEEIVLDLTENFRIAPINKSTVIKAIGLHLRYTYSYWDGLIIASALEKGCKILYSEDLQSGHIIENILKIVNPFKEIGRDRQ